MALVVDALATYRLTRLIVEDRIAERPRAALRARSPFLDELLACSWCTSVWAAVGVVVARQVAPRAWEPLARVLALSAVAGLVATAVSEFSFPEGPR